MCSNFPKGENCHPVHTFVSTRLQHDISIFQRNVSSAFLIRSAKGHSAIVFFL
jgi:hypothetical protein